MEDERFFVDKEYFSKTYKDPILREKEKNSKNLDKRKVASDLDAEENTIRNLVIDQFRAIENPETLTKEWFKDIISEYLHPGFKKKKYQVKIVGNDLIAVLDHYKNYKSNLAPNTIKKMGVVKSKLERYESDLNIKLKLTDINTNFRDEFIKWSNEKQYSWDNLSRSYFFKNNLLLRIQRTGFRNL